MLPNLEHIHNYRSAIKIFIDQISIFLRLMLHNCDINSEYLSSQLSI
ncbi:hypothetical protein VCRA2123O443_100011 [Vibrio crassostreae]|nr:hypothetical protein VCRA2110O182_100011 [Vibrio crassostreae]CAK2371967.1 hypothetical protein VCRA2111O408_90125 [Vibrio crassostreae]CAK2383284.1 hypothetical protein VCRA211O406_90123 [Vibrio crassostreae]CAK3017264.1 hypothetical protein VCRA2123O443_100011 [Vibrio crassostreae]